MTNDELLQSAGEFCPELFEKTATVMKLVERIEPEFARDVTEDINDILDVTQEKIAEYEKTAVDGSTLSRFMASGIGKAVKNVGIGVGAGIGASLLTSISTDIYDRATKALSKSSNYSAILKQNPELLKKYDKDVLNKSYSTLHRFAPEFTADPQLGAQLLSAMAETHGTMGQFTTVKDLLSSRKTLQETKAKRFQPRFQFGAKDKHKES